jgi:MipA family protein
MTHATLAMSIALAAALSSGAAAAQEQRTAWTVTVGAGAIAAPAYPGSASLRTLPVPLVEARYGDRFFLSPLGTGVNLVAERRLRLGVSVAPDLGRGADAVRGLAGIGPAADAKLFAEVGLGPVGLLADVRHQVGGGNGTLADAGVQAHAPLPGVFVSAAAMLTWADGRYMRSYFGAAGTPAGLRSFTPGAGLREASLSLMAFHRFDEHWGAQALARAALLLGDAAASPVAEQSVQPTLGGFLTYKI